MSPNLHTLDCESVELPFSGPCCRSRETRLLLLRAVLVACAPHPHLMRTVSSFPNGRRHIWFQVIGGKDRLKMSSVLFHSNLPSALWDVWLPRFSAGGRPCLPSAFSPLFHPAWPWLTERSAKAKAVCGVTLQHRSGVTGSCGRRSL